ncbi:AAA family ATPase [Pseudomonadales bacterium]|nr:AAA family ATPase [Pseudomonadales bacterium]
MTLALTQALLAGHGVQHACTNPRCIETHISWIVLLGEYAYKIKKPLNLGFLNYSTLALRKFYCAEEIRLNRRTAKDLYLQVVAISGTAAAPVVTAIDSGQQSTAEVFEYAVKMRRFPQSQLLTALAQHDQLNETVVESLARTIARFHLSLAKTVPEAFQPRDRIQGPVLDNFRHLLALALPERRQLLTDLQRWSETEYQRLEACLQRRCEQGNIRECHGDLHLDNILFDGQQCIVFDCIEFNPALYWIDTASDFAFTAMDLQIRTHADHARQLLNEYLALTGDYDMLHVFHYYLVYRALVKAKVHAIQAGQSRGQAIHEHHDQCWRYLRRAQDYCQPEPRGMVLMCGFSGSGKTTIARQLAQSTGFIHLRSDVERKRLFGLSHDANSQQLNLNIYTAEADTLTKSRLLDLSQEIYNAGYGVIIDATFIRADWRHSFLSLARQRSTPIRILQCQVSADETRTRLANRQGDASEATFEQFLAQQTAFDPFTDAEQSLLVTVNTQEASEITSTLTALTHWFQTPD